ncbi:hypothetical protein MA16_Dca001700 [Dendrobium catenatum]|uniref:Uncharacterized protein n=1 Tax=Dendrobium catenatum TaxID=906689 RepID=A0A2I0WN54_9ASPA|nr:hypothetical protein MA16_Dca001700 [Dendrobium catenatum]
MDVVTNGFAAGIFEALANFVALAGSLNWSNDRTMMNADLFSYPLDGHFGNQGFCVLASPDRVHIL